MREEREERKGRRDSPSEPVRRSLAVLGEVSSYSICGVGVDGGVVEEG